MRITARRDVFYFELGLMKRRRSHEAYSPRGQLRQTLQCTPDVSKTPGGTTTNDPRALMLQSNATVIPPCPILFYRPYLIYTTSNLILTLLTPSIEISFRRNFNSGRDVQLELVSGENVGENLRQKEFPLPSPRY